MGGGRERSWRGSEAEGERPDVLSRGGQQRLDPDRVETSAARAAEAASLLPVAEDRLDPGLPLPDEATGWSGAEVGDRTIPQAAVLRPRDRADLGGAAAADLQPAVGARSRPRSVDDRWMGGRRGRPVLARQESAGRAAIGVGHGIVAEGRARDEPVIAAAIAERDRRADVARLQPLIVVDRPVLRVGRDFEDAPPRVPFRLGDQARQELFVPDDAGRRVDGGDDAGLPAIDPDVDRVLELGRNLRALDDGRVRVRPAHQAIVQQPQPGLRAVVGAGQMQADSLPSLVHGLSDRFNHAGFPTVCRGGLNRPGFPGGSGV